MKEQKYDLENRLIEFSSSVIDIVDALPINRAGTYLGGQLIRCRLAPSLIYGEAQAAESREDFIHKMKVGLKELKETRVCLKLINKQKMLENLSVVMSENEQLISIISKSIITAKRNTKTL